MSSTKQDDRRNGLEDVERGFLEGMFEALANKHSQLDINFQKTTLKVPGVQASVELNGTISVTVHLRELTEEEKQASAQRNLALMSVPKVS
ncbi:MAG TPA: hypothetical protein VJN71_00975 [Nitrososphaerales archaeon]|nr:hypothetical protein [Nitrososphaerales archaeon]